MAIFVRITFNKLCALGSILVLALNLSGIPSNAEPEQLKSPDLSSVGSRSQSPTTKSTERLAVSLMYQQGWLDGSFQAAKYDGPKPGFEQAYVRYRKLFNALLDTVASKVDNGTFNAQYPLVDLSAESELIKARQALMQASQQKDTDPYVAGSTVKTMLRDLRHLGYFVSSDPRLKLISNSVFRSYALDPIAWCKWRGVALEPGLVVTITDWPTEQFVQIKGRALYCKFRYSINSIIQKHLSTSTNELDERALTACANKYYDFVYSYRLNEKATANAKNEWKHLDPSKIDYQTYFKNLRKLLQSAPSPTRNEALIGCAITSFYGNREFAPCGN